ncbi:MAG: hypothetical protein ABEJ61_08800 [Haloferacaceae archaeon]
MQQDWFTEEGKSGTLSIERRDGTWYVASSTEAGETICLLDETVRVESDNAPLEVEVTVSSFRRGTGDNANFLSLTAATEADQGRNEMEESKSSSRNEVPSDDQQQSSTNEDWVLNDFRGSGEYVNVEATIDAVFMVDKDDRHTPDVKGELTDDSVLNPVYFVVDHGVSHPYILRKASGSGSRTSKTTSTQRRRRSRSASTTTPNSSNSIEPISEGRLSTHIGNQTETAALPASAHIIFRSQLRPLL